MSHDEVDNLHAAEDHIGLLEHAMRGAVTEIEKVLSEGGVLSAPELRDLRSTLVMHIGYCRLDCANGDCSEDCGCQAHGEGPHPGWLEAKFDALVAKYRPCTAADWDGDTFVLVERSVDNGATFVTTHATLATAANYHDGQDRPEEWVVVEVVNVDTDDRFEVDTVTTTFRAVL